MGIWTVRFGAVMNRYEQLHGCLRVDTFPFLLTGYTGVGLLGCMVTHFLRKCQMASRSGCTVFTFPPSARWLQPLSPHQHLICQFCVTVLMGASHCGLGECAFLWWLMVLSTFPNTNYRYPLAYLLWGSVYSNLLPLKKIGLYVCLLTLESWVSVILVTSPSTHIVWRVFSSLWLVFSLFFMVSLNSRAHAFKHRVIPSWVVFLLS